MMTKGGGVLQQPENRVLFLNTKPKHFSTGRPRKKRPVEKKYETIITLKT